MANVDQKTSQQPTAEQLRDIAEHSFGMETLREGQLEAMEAAVGGRDVLAVMPTGHGKSAVYQVSGVAMPGTAVVVPEGRGAGTEAAGEGLLPDPDVDPGDGVAAVVGAVGVTVLFVALGSVWTISRICSLNALRRP